MIEKLNCSLYEQNCRPLADVMLRITGERIATPACGLVRNDMFSLRKASILSAESKIFSVIARERSDRGNPFPGIRKDANARRAFQFHHLNNNLLPYR